MRMRSTTPLKFSSAPMGIWIGQGFAFRRVFIMSTTRKKFAPVRSILFTKAIRGTPYLSAWRHTVSDWGCTPPTAQNTATAPSSTRRERSTSAVKSTWPGVSMMLMRCSTPVWPPVWGVQVAVMAAEVMVMPRSCSWTIQSVVAAPSCTSPILWILPV